MNEKRAVLEKDRAERNLRIRYSAPTVAAKVGLAAQNATLAMDLVECRLERRSSKRWIGIMLQLIHKTIVNGKKQMNGRLLREIINR